MWRSVGCKPLVSVFAERSEIEVEATKKKNLRYKGNLRDVMGR